MASAEQINYSKRLHDVIPGGSHTYSRGDDQYPANAPQILDRGHGAYVWDARGTRFLDYGMALRSVTLGYAHDDVNKAAFAEIEKGNNLTRASITELQAAELLRDLVPGTDMVKFAKNGSNVTSAAIKLARAYTGRKYIAVCAEQPFFSFDDWFIGSTVLQRGVPEEHHVLTLKFNYNNISSLQDLFTRYPGQIAGVIMEPATANLNPCAGDNSKGDPFRVRQWKTSDKPNFLQLVKNECTKNGAVFIIDEMISGFRWNLQGAQKVYNVQGDLSTFGKGMANGFSVAALTGRREIMELGGILNQGEERTFLISTTHGAEMCGLGAFIKTVELYKKHDVVNHLWNFGEKLINGMNAISKEYGILDQFYFEGFPCSPNYVAKNEKGEVSLALRTLFSQEMIAQNVLMPWVAVSLAHGSEELDITLSAARRALRTYADALDQGVEKFLVGKAIKPVFRKFN